MLSNHDDMDIDEQKVRQTNKNTLFSQLNIGNKIYTLVVNTHQKKNILDANKSSNLKQVFFLLKILERFRGTEELSN